VSESPGARRSSQASTRAPAVRGCCNLPQERSLRRSAWAVDLGVRETATAAWLSRRRRRGKAPNEARFITEWRGGPDMLSWRTRSR
jgi:hypothetical protein